MVYDAFAEMVECRNMSDLTKIIEDWSRKIFSVHQVKFYLVEKDALIYYQSKDQQ